MAARWNEESWKATRKGGGKKNDAKKEMRDGQ